MIGRAALVAGCLIASVLSALAATPPLKGLGIDETLDTGPVLAEALDRVRPRADTPLFVRLILRRADLAPGADSARLESRLDLYARRRVPVMLVVADPPLDVAAVDAWRLEFRALVERCRGKVAGYQMGDRLTGNRATPAAYAYLLKFAAVQARSIDPGLLVFQAGLSPDSTAWLEELYEQGVAAYSDGVTVSPEASEGSLVERQRAAFFATESLVERRDPDALLGSTGLQVRGDAAQAAERFLAWHFSTLGGRARFTTMAAGAETVAAVLKNVSALTDVAAGDLTTLDEGGSSLQLTLDGREVTASLPHRLLYDTTRFATYLLCAPGAGVAGTLEIRLHLPTAGRVVSRSLRDGALREVTAARDEAARTTRVRMDLTPGHAVLLDFNHGAEEVYALRSDASGRALPTVEGVVSRHQQAEAAQQALYRNYMAAARVHLHFRPTTTDSGYDVVLENRFFWEPDTAEWEEHGFTLNGTRWGRNRPPFPMLQPEKVLSLPLSLRFTRDYAYHLEGVEKLGERRCYVVRFDPVRQDQSLYRGKVWIDAERFVRLKVQAVQTRLAPPLVSNEEVQHFQPVATPGGDTVYLFSRLDSKQILLLAGRNVLVEKRVEFSGFRVDDQAFAAERQGARAGDNVMYRDTDQGLRYLVKRGRERVVSDRLTTTAKAFLLGASIDPSYDYPVPMGGLDYLDFDFLDKDLQFALIFAGVLAMGNVQKARIGGTGFDLNVDFFGIALTGFDQVYDEVGERKGERLRTRPASVGANLGYQVDDFQKVTFSTHLQHDTYKSAPDDTADGFVLPPSGFTLNTGVAYEYRRGGYSVAAAYSYARRADWRRWGLADQAFDPATRTYAKYHLGVNKDFVFNAFSKLRLNAAYYGGQRQDRFSMYRFGLFDETRMRGVPSAGIRFSEMLMQRAQYSFNLLDLYRLDLFYDHAWGRTGEGPGWSRTTGVGTEISLRGPMGTMLKAGVGKGLLPRAYRGSGSWVVEATLLKPL